jgi:[acyl-carrier-protein] S-malonyltransferase
MKTAFVFPGQGSQYAGMGRDVYERHASAKKVFDEADAALGFSISRLCFDGPEESLKLTENTQPAILTVSIALLRALEERGLRPAFVAGHSLGEYSALVAAGALDFADAVRLVRRRGRYMQEAVPVGVGGMAAILGLDVAAVEAICAEAAAGDVVRPANLNSPTQVVIAGHVGAVERAVALAKGAGAKRAVTLSVSAPFHCELLEPAAVRLSADLDALRFEKLACPLVTNVDARPIVEADEAKDALKRQVARPVRWSESVRRMLDGGAETFVEIGPGKVLTGLVRSIDKSVRTINVEDEKSLENAFGGLL